jgi:hypothetical protein
MQIAAKGARKPNGYRAQITKVIEREVYSRAGISLNVVELWDGFEQDPFGIQSIKEKLDAIVEHSVNIHIINNKDVNHG